MSDGDNSFPSVSKYQEVISAILKEGSHNIINIKDSNNTWRLLLSFSLFLYMDRSIYSSRQPYEVGPLSIIILQMQKRRFGDVQSLA